VQKNTCRFSGRPGAIPILKINVANRVENLDRSMFLAVPQGTEGKFEIDVVGPSVVRHDLLRGWVLEERELFSMLLETSCHRHRLLHGPETCFH
jgi:hypothetical protein